MIVYRLERAGHSFPALSAVSDGAARIAVEEMMEHQTPPGFGFRWIHAAPFTWRYEVVSEDVDFVKLTADLVRE